MTEATSPDRRPATPAAYAWALLLREHGLRATEHHVETLTHRAWEDSDGS